MLCPNCAAPLTAPLEEHDPQCEYVVNDRLQAALDACRAALTIAAKYLDARTMTEADYHAVMAELPRAEQGSDDG